MECGVTLAVEQQQRRFGRVAAMDRKKKCFSREYITFVMTRSHTESGRENDGGVEREPALITEQQLAASTLLVCVYFALILYTSSSSNRFYTEFVHRLRAFSSPSINNGLSTV